jgi:hypothetical protein
LSVPVTMRVIMLIMMRDHADHARIIMLLRLGYRFMLRRRRCNSVPPNMLELRTILAQRDRSRCSRSAGLYPQLVGADIRARRVISGFGPKADMAVRQRRAIGGEALKPLKGPKNN